MTTPEAQPTARTAAEDPTLQLVGRELKDNDPRASGRRLVVVSVNDGIACCGRVDRSARTVTVALRRIFVDGKQRKHGFTLLPATPQITAPALEE